MSINKKPGLNPRRDQKALKEAKKKARLALEAAEAKRIEEEAQRAKEEAQKASLAKIKTNIQNIRNLAKTYQEFAYDLRVKGEDEDLIKNYLNQVVDLEMLAINMDCVIREVEIAKITTQTFNSMTDLPELLKNLIGDIKQVNFGDLTTNMKQLQNYIKDVKSYLADFRNNTMTGKSGIYQEVFNEEHPDVKKKREERLKKKLAALDARYNTENPVPNVDRTSVTQNDTEKALNTDDIEWFGASSRF